MSAHAKAALVTGAGTGIGLATARALASAGFALVLSGRRAAPLEEAARELERAGGRASALPCDIGDAAAARALVESAAARLGRLDVLINNAGDAPRASIEQHTPEMIAACFAVNAIGPANTIAAAWPIMTAQRGGVIVNVSSMATKDPFPGFFAYAAAKAAVNLLARTAAKEGAAVGIRAFSVAPGAVETAMLRSSFDEKVIVRSAALSPEAVAKLILECVLGRHNRENGQTLFLSA